MATKREKKNKIFSETRSQVRTYERKRKTSKILLFEVGRLRTLIFGMYNILVDLYQVCSYRALGVKIGPTL